MKSDFFLLILSSPSGAGKTTLTHMLQKSFPELRFSVSHTTRPPRGDEVNGRDYHFIDRSTFQRMIEQGDFLEWAEVHGNLYGTSLTEIEQAKQNRCTGMIFDIDYQGARQIRAKIDSVVSVFILPPSMAELERRLRGRASESEEAVQARFAVAKKEIEHYPLFDHLIVNSTLDRAFEELKAVLIAEQTRRWKRAPLAEALLRKGDIEL